MERETIALWREAGEWWKGEPERVVHRYIDAQGILREDVTTLPARGEVRRTGQAPRIRKVRDEKVSRATGFANEPSYGSAIVSPGAASGMPAPGPLPTSGDNASETHKQDCQAPNSIPPSWGSAGREFDASTSGTTENYKTNSEACHSGGRR